jgi:sulfopyruvate decarboxylase TPP-binding subunit
MPQSPPQSVPAAMILEALRACGVRTVVTVPDTHQRTLLAALAAAEDVRLITCATEDEATAINAGLWIGGDEPALLIQHAGLYASVNTLRGVAIDGRIPTFSLIGLLHRDRDPLTPLRAARGSMLRYCLPLLDAFGVPYALLDGPEDIGCIAAMFRISRERRGPAAVLVGMPTR